LISAAATAEVSRGCCPQDCTPQRRIAASRERVAIAKITIDGISTIALAEPTDRLVAASAPTIVGLNNIAMAVPAVMAPSPAEGDYLSTSPERERTDPTKDPVAAEAPGRHTDRKGHKPIAGEPHAGAEVIGQAEARPVAGRHLHDDRKRPGESDQQQRDSPRRTAATDVDLVRLVRKRLICTQDATVDRNDHNAEHNCRGEQVRAEIDTRTGDPCGR